jgi:hypothetical protein
VAWDARTEPIFCGDAIADPLTGLTGALAVLAAREAGGGVLIDLSLSQAAAAAVTGSGSADASHPGCRDEERPEVVSDERGGWLVRLGNQAEPVRDAPECLDLILSPHA